MTSKTTRPRISTILSLSVVAMLTTGGILYAGPLDPPAGPIVSTGKTLTEVEPRIAINQINTPGGSDSMFTISQPGSYYLTGTLQGVPGKNGILISTAGTVTIDLNGFQIVGPNGPGNLKGIYTQIVTSPSVTIRNGTILLWSGNGIDLTAPAGIPSSTLIDLRVRNNGANGISCGPGTTLMNCIADDNGAVGIATGAGCVLESCIALSNNADGFFLGNGSNISDCVAYLNSDDGIVVGVGCTVTACTIYANTGDGIEVGNECLIAGNTCSRNGFQTGNGAGIRMVGSDNRIEDNNCSGADRGIEAAASRNIIIRNTCTGNGTNWVFVAGNSFGSIIVSSSALAPAINTNGGAAGTLTTTDPNANFSY